MSASRSLRRASYLPRLSTTVTLCYLCSSLSNSLNSSIEYHIWACPEGADNDEMHVECNLRNWSG